MFSDECMNMTAEDVHLVHSLRVKLLTDSAILPARADAGSVGYDLHADLGAERANRTIYNGMRAAIPTGIAIAVPAGCYGRIAPLSSLAARHGLDVMAGVIDPGYHGAIKVVLVNHGDIASTIVHGDCIAQLIIERCETPPVVKTNDLRDTERSAGR